MEVTSNQSPTDILAGKITNLADAYYDHMETDTDQAITRVRQFLDGIKSSPESPANAVLMVVEQGPLAKPLSSQMLELYNTTIKSLSPHLTINQGDTLVYQTNIPDVHLVCDETASETKPGVNESAIKLVYKKP